jgi:hypothetical protein
VPKYWEIFPDEPEQKTIKEIVTQSDRITAVVGGAMLDMECRRTLEVRLRQDKDMSDKLFKSGGSLFNLDPKITLLYQLYAMDRPCRTAMFGLATIRNVFAHQLDANFNSSDKKMMDAFKNLTLHEGHQYYPNYETGADSANPIEPVTSNRARFISNLKLAVLWLMIDRRSHKMWSNTPVSPST